MTINKKDEIRSAGNNFALPAIDNLVLEQISDKVDYM